jgi:hypothetical protein
MYNRYKAYCMQNEDKQLFYNMLNLIFLINWVL